MSLQLLEAKDQFIMADQNVVAIHHVSFLVVQLFSRPNKLAFVKQSYLVHFHYFFSQAWFFCIVCQRFQKDPSKTEVSKCL